MTWQDPASGFLLIAAINVLKRFTINATFNVLERLKREYIHFLYVRLISWE